MCNFFISYALYSLSVSSVPTFYVGNQRNLQISSLSSYLIAGNCLTCRLYTNNIYNVRARNSLERFPFAFQLQKLFNVCNFFISYALYSLSVSSVPTFYVGNQRNLQISSLSSYLIAGNCLTCRLYTNNIIKMLFFSILF